MVSEHSTVITTHPFAWINNKRIWIENPVIDMVLLNWKEITKEEYDLFNGSVVKQK